MAHSTTAPIHGTAATSGTAATTAHGSGGHGGSNHHVVPLSTLVTVFAILMVLTVATVGATLFDFGYTLNLVLAMGIAVVKAAIVMLYFMHLRWDNPFNAVVAIGSLLFIAIFIVVCIVDTGEYSRNYTPPGVGQSAPR